MSTFTKEQLIEKLQHRISVASRFPESEKAQMDLELARIALASLEADGTLANEGTITATQFKPVADLYGLTSPTGSETSFTFDAVEARDFIDGGWSCQEYVELERFQEAITNHTGDSNNMVEPVTTAYKLPDDFICMLTGRAKYLREKGEIKSPELLERAAAALQGESVNTSSIPNGWKLVPIDPTKDMLRAGQSVVGLRNG
ncbi:hypothetical protein [Escherichia coli]|uniref:hypothetical protein n=1 Tax=Escherichia coli TaxID=562 RepID=UPI00132AE4A0|nr:hypothetical protein [Escherichia coli]MCB4537473.1 hypothetical protein [Escherichia coli]MWC94319.1 hypothetical protein [Escherichia coli]